MKKTIIGLLILSLLTVGIYVLFIAPSDGQTAAERLKQR